MLLRSAVFALICGSYIVADALAVVIAASNTVIELFAPRGTDDFFMATANAALCLAFGTLLA